MRCHKCGNEAAFFQSYSGRHLCGRHLARDIEVRAKRTIRSHRWLSCGDHIAAVISGDRKSAALLCFLKKLTAGRRDIRLSAVASCGEGPGTGDRPAAVALAESLGIPVVQTLSEGVSLTGDGCGTTRIALARSLDDIAEEVLGQFLFGEVESLVHPPRDGNIPNTVICPFITIPADELDLYGEMGIPGCGLIPYSPGRDTPPQEVRALLEGFCRGHPATKYALLHLAEQIRDGNASSDRGPGFQ